MKSNNGIIYVAIALGSFFNIVTIVFMMVLANSNELVIEITRFMAELKLFLYLSAAVSLAGLFCSFIGLFKLADIANYDITVSELKEEKEKYELATTAFMELQKTKRIN